MHLLYVVTVEDFNVLRYPSFSGEGDIYKVFVPDRDEAVSILSAKYQPFQTSEPVWNMKLDVCPSIISANLQYDSRYAQAIII